MFPDGTYSRRRGSRRSSGMAGVGVKEGTTLRGQVYVVDVTKTERPRWSPSLPTTSSSRERSNPSL